MVARRGQFLAGGGGTEPLITVEQADAGRSSVLRHLADRPIWKWQATTLSQTLSHH